MRGYEGAPFAHACEYRDAPAFLGVGIGLRSVDDLARLAAHDGVAVEPLDAPGGGMIARLTDPDGFVVEAVAGQTAVEVLPAPASEPWNHGGVYPRRSVWRRVPKGASHVRRLGHVVLGVADFRRSEAWYKDRFGFITSDEIQPAPGVAIGAFMRADRGDEPSDHHTLFLMERPAPPGFMHGAFEVRDLDDLMTGHDHLVAQGYDHQWGNRPAQARQPGVRLLARPLWQRDRALDRRRPARRGRRRRGRLARRPARRPVGHGDAAAARAGAVSVDCDLLVVGLGPVGDVMAALARLHGLSVIAIDRALAIHDCPRAAVFDDEVMRIFQMAGVAERMVPHTRTPDRYQFLTANGEVLLDFGVGGIGRFGWPASHLFHQPACEAVCCCARLRELGVDVRLGVAFTGLTEDADGVSVGIAVDGTPSSIRARYVVACDGGSSPVRVALGIDLDDYGFDEPWLVVDVLIDNDHAPPVVTQQICDPARPVTHMGDDRWSFPLGVHGAAGRVGDRAGERRQLAHPARAVGRR